MYIKVHFLSVRKGSESVLQVQYIYIAFYFIIITYFLLKNKLLRTFKCSFKYAHFFFTRDNCFVRHCVLVNR